ncbi:MAG: DUF4857 domain-containing protein [Chlorobi bacterium]|nr:DUF4857 domain-containing protein [Chlorobiota bacterium]
MTKQQLRSLISKERIKLRRGIWLLPMLLLYSAADSLLALHSLQRAYGSFGLWETIVFRQPQFFGRYFLVVVCAVLIGFLQAWPESQGKRLRLLYHTPIEPVSGIAVMLATGTILLLLVNIAATALFLGTMQWFHFPREIIHPAFLTVLPWILLSIAAYYSSVAFFSSGSPGVRLLIGAALYPIWNMLGARGAYGLYEHSIWIYGFVAFLFVFVACYAILHYMRHAARGSAFVFSRMITIILAICGLGSVLLALYWKIVIPADPHTSMHFSPVHRQFVISDFPAGKGAAPDAEPSYLLENGTTLSREQYRAALPFLYVRDLVKWEMFPESIGGVAISALEAERAWQFVRLSSFDWNSPPPMLHMLLESNPAGARLQKPDDFFRVSYDGYGIEFLTPHNGITDRPKSRAFTNALGDAGFIYPIRAVGGNPDVRKRYDVGYFLADSAGSLFQMRMVDGKPACRRLEGHIEGSVRQIHIKEHHRQEYYGFIVTDRALYAVMQKDGALKRIPVGRFNADDLTLALWSDILYTSVSLESTEMNYAGRSGIAMTPDFRVVHRYMQPTDAVYLESVNVLKTFAAFLFPVQIMQDISGSSFRYLQVRYAESVPAALSGSVFALVVFALISRLGFGLRRGSDYALVAVFGLTAVLVLLLSETDSFLSFTRRN